MIEVLTLSNNTCDFITNLSPPIFLNPNVDYEAAFISLTTYNSIPNITEDNNKFRYSSDKGQTWKEITLPTGAFEFMEINTKIQSEMATNNDFDQEHNSFYIYFDYYKPTFKTILNISNEDYVVDFNIQNSIASILGFNKVTLKAGIHESTNIINIKPVNSVLIHCDAVIGSYINTYRSNVIHCFSPQVSPGYEFTERPTPELIYHPLVKRPELSSIRVWLTDQSNKPINLSGEIVTIVIKIREKLH